MFMIYFINMQSLTQTNVLLTLVLHTHLQDTNVLHVSSPRVRCDASPANNQNEARSLYCAPSRWTLNNALSFWETRSHMTSLLMLNKVLYHVILTLHNGKLLLHTAV